MAQGSARSNRTIDHDEIREWIEARDGVPSIVRRSGDTGGGERILRVDFGEPEESLQEISWDEFFRIFDDNDLAFLYQEETPDGELSRFCEFVPRAGAEEEPEEDGDGALREGEGGPADEEDPEEIDRGGEE